MYRQNLFQGFLLFILLSSNTLSLAGSPVICRYANIVFADQKAQLNVNLQQARSSIYFIHNISKQTLLLNRLAENGKANAGWGSKLNAQRWSALLLSETNFSLSCFVLKKNNMNPVNCQDYISICQSNLLPMKNGNYWLLENKNWKVFVPGVLAKLKKMANA